MEISLLIFFLLITFNSISIEARFTNCPTTPCCHGGPKIQPPFQVQGRRQALQCGRSGFELSCEGNNTKIHFPDYGFLIVKSISYDRKKLSLLDPNGCVHGVFLNLNLSLTPFHYFYVVKDYLYLNCTAKLPSFSEVPCLSQSGSYVYVVKPPLMAVPRFCRAVKTVVIPFEYSPYLADNSFGLALTWRFDQSETGYQTGGFLKATNNQVLRISFLGAMVAILMVFMKIYHSNKQNHPKEMVFGHSLGTYEALQHT